jgi:hypothetical protein
MKRKAAIITLGVVLLLWILWTGFAFMLSDAAAGR